jgi:hypothetical protein
MPFQVRGRFNLIFVSPSWPQASVVMFGIFFEFVSDSDLEHLEFKSTLGFEVEFRSGQPRTHDVEG